MLVKNKYAKDAAAWCGLNRTDMKPEDADCIIFGIPFDGGVSYRGGAAEAPDALDPAYAAGTGTPQFGGLTSRMALTLLERIFTELNIIGFDVVEMAPPLDPSLASMYAGRKIIQEAWGYWADKIGKLEKRK